MMTSRERVLCALAGQVPDVVPFAEHLIESAVVRALLGPMGTPRSDPSSLRAAILTLSQRIPAHHRLLAVVRLATPAGAERGVGG